jgi:hypothetical protein
MKLPSYWRERPAFTLTRKVCAAFDEVLAAAQPGMVAPLRYDLDLPRWQFLCYLAEVRAYALHGSPNHAIVEFEPRQSRDLNSFGAQRAVYAAADGIWPMYFALLDRARYPTTLINGCIRVIDRDGRASGPYYQFSVGKHVLSLRPWQAGTVYILPKETFVPEPPIPFEDLLVQTTQLASPVAVRPIAKLAIAPEDFPFLDQVMAHEDARLEEYTQALRTGAPWPEG